MTSFYIPLNYDSQRTDGAYFRSMQLLHSFGKTTELKIYSHKLSLSDLTNVIPVVKHFYIIFHICIWYSNSIMEALKLIIAVGRLQRSLRKCPQSKIFIDVGPGPARLVALYLLNICQTQVILCPHNVEFLACIPGNYSDQNDQKRMFALELKLYNLAKDILTISEFDMNIINALTKSEKAQVFPYKNDKTPPVVQAKGKRASTYFVVLGSLKNSPTLYSIKTLIENVNREYRFHVIGDGSEKLPAMQNIERLGRLPDQYLQNEICNCKAIVLYQVPTSGMLTRLHYLKKFGKPIFINKSYAQASEISFEKLHLYTSFSDLDDRLRQL